VAAEQQPLFANAIADAICGHAASLSAASVADGRAALGAIKQLNPDVAVLDANLPKLDGAAVLNALLRDGVATRSVVLLPDFHAPSAYDAIKAGAWGLVTKDANGDQLCRAITEVAAGRKVIPPELFQGLTDEIRLRDRNDRPLLTKRQAEVLVLLGEGLTAAEMAKQLYLSTATVKTHLSHLYAKLEVTDRAAAVREAMRRGLLE
jgi:two-component system nitrate/nitrite response regulator NarL